MKFVYFGLILAIFISGCTSSKTTKTPLEECLITDGPIEITTMHLNRYIKESLKYSKNLIAVYSPTSGGGRINNLTSRGRVLKCEAILKFDDGSSEKGTITNEISKTATQSLSYEPNIIIADIKAPAPTTPTSKGICIGDANNCSGTKDDEYYTPYPTTQEDIRRNEKYIINHKTYTCRSVSPSYAEGVRVREYIVFDPRDCR